MYAVIQHGSHQYRVSAGDRLLVDRLKADVGSTVRLEDVLLLGGGDSPKQDGLETAKAVVTATVVAHRRGRKLRVMTFKPKKRHRRTLGYRSQLTELLIDSVSADGSAPAAAKRQAPPKAQAKARSSAASKEQSKEVKAEGEPGKTTAKPRRTTAKKRAAETDDGA